MIDISDGLLADLRHIAVASGVRINVRRDAFTVPEPLQAVAAATGVDPWTLLLTGGEDHALAATFTSVDDVPADWLVVGEVTAGESDVLVDAGTWEGTRGWEHYRR